MFSVSLCCTGCFSFIFMTTKKNFKDKINANSFAKHTPNKYIKSQLDNQTSQVYAHCTAWSTEKQYWQLMFLETIFQSEKCWYLYLNKPRFVP